MKENIFRCFGISKEDVNSILNPALENSNGVFVDVSGDSLLVDIYLKTDDSNFYIYEFTRLIYEKLDQFIYCESNLSLEEVALQLLNVNKLKLATVEELTSGQIICNLNKNNSFETEILVEGIVPFSNHAKTARLNISREELGTNPSVQKARNLAMGLLNSSTADVVIATTGHRSFQNNTSEIFIAIGTSERIDVYKNILTGTKQEIIEITSNLALFYLIKKLRNFNSYLENN